MRRVTVSLLVFVVACLTPVCLIQPTLQAAIPGGAEQASSAPATKTEVKAGLGIEKMELTGASDSFKVAPDTKIYGWARVKEVAAGSNISLAFKRGDKEVFKKEISVPSVPFRVYAYRTFRAADSGDWMIVVTGPDGKELASTPLKVDISK